MKIVLDVVSCLDCPYHQVLPDPDLLDSFCSDDLKVVCKKANKDITVACRPYLLRKETDIPKWCPIAEKG